MSRARAALALPALLVALVALAAAAGCRPLDPAARADPPPTADTGASPAEVVRLLAALPVRPEDTGAHYRRADFGDGWAYDPATKCSVRETVLIRDGVGETVDGKCRPSCPATGPACWTSPYDGIATHDPRQVQVDHAAALAEVARSGARHWTRAQRVAFANDPENLLAVSATSNQSKSAADSGRWRPVARGSWCRLAETVVRVKTKYALHIDPAERDGLAAMLRTCPDGGDRR